jgi:signal transduction histidine kinase
MFRSLRYYWIASFAVILLAAAAIVVIFREVSIKGVGQIAESGNVSLGRMALSPVRDELADYLAAAGAGGSNKVAPLPRELHADLSELMRDTHVRRVKIYNRDGVVSFSTRPSDIGIDQSRNSAVVAALQGRVSSSLVYRDSFNSFDRATEEDNLVQSYLPIRRRPTEPVLGVFELYTDVGALVHQAQRSQMQVIMATLVILIAVYAALLAVVDRVRGVIERQQEMIRDKTAVLELLSQESLRREEGERKKFATDLHEGLAQTLSAVKLAIESAQGTVGAAPLKSVVTDLQGAISQVRTIAMDLRPPSLDDLGLVPTIDALCRDFGETYPGIRVDRHITAQESVIPARLKFVIYRIIEAALKVVGQRALATEVHIELGIEDRTLSLTVEDNGTAPESDAPHADLQSPFSAIHERAIITGGQLAVSRLPSGGLRMRASWSPIRGGVGARAHDAKMDV